jgi:serine protease Do
MKSRRPFLVRLARPLRLVRLVRPAPLVRSFFVPLAALALLAGPAFALPPLPGSSTASAAGGPPPGAPAPAPGSLEALKRGVVTLERDGKVLGVGTILIGDGRILAALSALGGGDLVDVKYADGSSVKGKVGHRDKVWDLALVVPQSGKWTDGLSASETDPTTVELRAFVPPRAGRVLQPIVQMKGRIDAKSPDNDPVTGALDVEVKGGGVVPSGAPITDPSGAVVGVFVRACKTADAGKCSPIAVGAPVSALRSFLVKTPASAVQPSAWLGIVGAPDGAANMRGVRVLQVAPQSPAEKGGLKADADRTKADLIVAVDRQPVDSPEKLGEAIAKHNINDAVKLLVFGGDGKYREVTVVLKAAP